MSPKMIQNKVVPEKIAHKLNSIITPPETPLKDKIYINNYKDIVED
jgi:hypothetical protein